MIKAVFFDIDDTMYNYTYANQVAMEILEGYCISAFKISSEDFHATFAKGKKIAEDRVGSTCAAMHNRLIRYQCMLELWGFPILPYARTMAELYWKTFIDTMIPEDGLLTFLNDLKKAGIYIGVGTNMTAYVQYLKLEKLGVDRLIDGLVTSEESGIEKPAKGFFDLCVQKSGFKKEECLFIGDDLKNDVGGAKAAGLNSAWYCKRKNHPQKQDNTDVLCIESYENIDVLTLI